MSQTGSHSVQRSKAAHLHAHCSLHSSGFPPSFTHASAHPICPWCLTSYLRSMGSHGPRTIGFLWAPSRAMPCAHKLHTNRSSVEQRDDVCLEVSQASTHAPFRAPAVIDHGSAVGCVPVQAAAGCAPVQAMCPSLFKRRQDVLLYRPCVPPCSSGCRMCSCTGHVSLPVQAAAGCAPVQTMCPSLFKRLQDVLLYRPCVPPCSSGGRMCSCSSHVSLPVQAAAGCAPVQAMCPSLLKRLQDMLLYRPCVPPCSSGCRMCSCTGHESLPVQAAMG